MRLHRQLISWGSINVADRAVILWTSLQLSVNGIKVFSNQEARVADFQSWQEVVDCGGLPPSKGWMGCSRPRII